jgi:hypothetical protein
MTTQDLIEWRRAKVVEYVAKGKSLTEIAEILKVSLPTISRDVKDLREEAKQKQQDYIDNELPFQHKLAVSNLDKIIEEAWKLYESEEDSRSKIAALNVIAEAVMKKQAVLGDPEQIEKAIRVVAQLRKQLQEDSSGDDTERSNYQEASQ